MSDASEAPPSDLLAAVDLGSNSFHMIIARELAGELRVLDRLKEPVRLAMGLDAENRLSHEARSRALACLQRFGQRLRDCSPERVRAVGTNTLRNARNVRGFLRRAREALGVEIEVLPGAEEARLVYLGVAHDLADDAGRRLVVDIGGGSTELVVGERFEILVTASRQMGCVSSTTRFFPKGRITAEGFEQARIAARVELLSVEDAIKRTGFDDAVGSSGTANAVAAILEQNDWSKGGITREGIEHLERALIAAGSVERIDVPGLMEDRRPVIAGGVAVLGAVFDALGLERMRASTQALREGLLYDLLGRIHHHDVRDRTIESLRARYALDLKQAARVEQTARALLAQVAEPWELDLEHHGQFLGWAAALHEIGLAVRHSGYHKHGAYLVANSDLPGFSADDQRFLACLVRTQRRKISRGLFADLPPHHVREALRCAVLFRLAVCLRRGRATSEDPPLQLRAGRGRLRLKFPTGWLVAHPLVRADLTSERALLAGIGFELELPQEDAP